MDIRRYTCPHCGIPVRVMWGRGTEVGPTMVTCAECRYRYVRTILANGDIEIMDPESIGQNDYMSQTSVMMQLLRIEKLATYDVPIPDPEKPNRPLTFDELADKGDWTSDPWVNEILIDIERLYGVFSFGQEGPGAASD